MMHKVDTYTDTSRKSFALKIPPPSAPAPPRPQPGCGPASSSSDAHSVTLDMLHWSLLDFSYPLTSCTSAVLRWALTWRCCTGYGDPLLPATMCEVVPRLVTRPRNAHCVTRHLRE
jgi:hypothetical protein